MPVEPHMLRFPVMAVALMLAQLRVALDSPWPSLLATIGLSEIGPMLAEFPSLHPVTGDPRMAYLNRTITLRFDGESTLDGVPETDDAGKPIRDDAGKVVLRVLPNLGDDVWVTVHNPMLMPQSMLLPRADVETKPDGTPVDREAALTAGAEVVAGLIVDWSLTDVFDTDPEPSVLPLPATADVLRNHVPIVVGDSIAALLNRARNPR